jgi:hypothetical protein
MVNGDGDEQRVPGMREPGDLRARDEAGEVRPLAQPAVSAALGGSADDGHDPRSFPFQLGDEAGEITMTAAEYTAFRERWFAHFRGFDSAFLLVLDEDAD